VEWITQDIDNLRVKQGFVIFSSLRVISVFRQGPVLSFQYRYVFLGYRARLRSKCSARTLVLIIADNNRLVNSFSIETDSGSKKSPKRALFLITFMWTARRELLAVSFFLGGLSIEQSPFSQSPKGAHPVSPGNLLTFFVTAPGIGDGYFIHSVAMPEELDGNFYLKIESI
jgi:hypothetical protein